MTKTDSLGNVLPKTIFITNANQLEEALAVNTFRLATDHAMSLGHTVEYDATTKTAVITKKDTGFATCVYH